MKRKNLDSPKTQTITESEAAALLTDPQGQRFLAPFLAKESSVAEAAKQLGIPTNSLLYRVNQMARLGLIQVVREEARAGRPIKIYRSSADAFFVPFALTPAESLEALLTPTGSHWDRLFVRNATQMLSRAYPEIGIQIWRGETDELYAKPASEPGRWLDFSSPEVPPMLAFWSAGLWLNEEQARSLQLEMVQLYQRYAQFKGKQRYITHLAMAPWVLEESPS